MVVDNDTLLVAADENASPVTVVTFASAGFHLAGLPVHEFHAGLKRDADLSHASAPLNVISVIDRTRCWFNNGLTRDVTRIVNGLLDDHGCLRTVTLGTSMGGYGAIVFAGRLHRCDRAIAFGAHFSVCPALVPFDTRSPDLRARILDWDVVSAGDALSAHVQYDLFYGDADEIDAHHAALFESRRAPNISITFVTGASHNCAGHLKQQGDLYSMLHRRIRTAPQHGPSRPDPSPGRLDAVEH